MNTRKDTTSWTIATNADDTETTLCLTKDLEVHGYSIDNEFLIVVAEFNALDYDEAREIYLNFMYGKIE